MNPESLMETWSLVFVTKSLLVNMISKNLFPGGNGGRKRNIKSATLHVAQGPASPYLAGGGFGVDEWMSEGSRLGHCRDVQQTRGEGADC